MGRQRSKALNQLINASYSEEAFQRDPALFEQWIREHEEQEDQQRKQHLNRPVGF